MQTYLVVTPEESTAALRHTRAIALAAYRIGAGNTLLRRDPVPQVRGGLLCISDCDAPPIGDTSTLCAAVLRECSRRSCNGVLLDFEQPPTSDRRSFVQRLSCELHVPLYLPSSYANDAAQGITLLCSAISGGNFREYLEDACKTRGGERMALDVQRLCMDFRLPCPSGEGQTLERREFQRLMEQQPTIFFSPDLCARYFTYAQNGQTHFVLFDDAETLKRKTQLAAELGFAAAFFLWPEVEDLASQLHWQDSSKK